MLAGLSLLLSPEVAAALRMDRTNPGARGRGGRGDLSGFSKLLLLLDGSGLPTRFSRTWTKARTDGVDGSLADVTTPVSLLLTGALGQKDKVLGRAGRAASAGCWPGMTRLRRISLLLLLGCMRMLL